MEKEKIIRSTSFRIPLELAREFKTACAQRDTDQATVVIEAIRKFVEGPEEKRGSTAPEAHFDRWHQMLTEVLASGDREAIDSVRSALKSAHRIVELLRRDRHGGLPREVVRGAGRRAGGR